VVVDVKLEKIFSRQLLNSFLIPSDLVLDLNQFRVALRIQLIPELLNFIHPILMSSVAGFMGRLAFAGFQSL